MNRRYRFRVLTATGQQLYERTPSAGTTQTSPSVLPTANTLPTNCHSTSPTTACQTGGLSNSPPWQQWGAGVERTVVDRGWKGWLAKPPSSAAVPVERKDRVTEGIG